MHRKDLPKGGGLLVVAKQIENFPADLPDELFEDAGGDERVYHVFQVEKGPEERQGADEQERDVGDVVAAVNLPEDGEEVPVPRRRVGEARIAQPARESGTEEAPK